MTAKEHENLFQWSKKLHWLRWNEEGQCWELYLDNHMMQTWRMCEARFFEDHLVGLKGKNEHVWFLDFGTAVHTMVEYYYLHFRDADFDVMYWAGTLGFKVWTEMRMDEYYSKGTQWHHKNYEYLGGALGFGALLLQYANHFKAENERFRVIGTELYFGKAKEVPLLDNPYRYSWAPFRLYLCGKIDLLVDNGTNIGPMDHKTSSFFGGKNPATSYELHDGMTGYVYAAKKLLEQEFKNDYGTDKYNFLARNTNQIFMNFLQVKPEDDPSKRFKRLPLYKTNNQLEEYVGRQISTASSIFNLLCNGNRKPFYNTMVCDNYMRHTCPHKRLHSQNDEQSRLTILNADYTTGNHWDPENRDNDNIL